MGDSFFEKPILNSPYEYPVRHWELDDSGQPTNRILDHRRRAEFITPIPKPKKRKQTDQSEIVFDEGKGLSTEAQQYDPTPIINELRQHVDQWRTLPNQRDWLVTPETARLLPTPKTRLVRVIRGCAVGRVYPLDGNHDTVWLAPAYIRGTVRSGSIVILHDGDGRGRRTARILAHVLPALADRGFRFVTLSELAGIGGAGRAASALEDARVNTTPGVNVSRR